MVFWRMLAWYHQNFAKGVMVPRCVRLKVVKVPTLYIKIKHNEKVYATQICNQWRLEQTKSAGQLCKLRNRGPVSQILASFTPYDQPQI
ncbi:hypothetical protein QQP08_008681, partial [Theobroma cacao]